MDCLIRGYDDKKKKAIKPERVSSGIMSVSKITEDF